jgi:hypothetical protein
VKSYRFHLSPAKRAPGQVLDMMCVNDGDAMMQCHRLLADCTSVEAWDGDRLLIRMSRPHSNQSPHLPRAETPARH